MVSRQNSVCLGSSLSMRSFAIEEPGSPVPPLYATLPSTIKYHLLFIIWWVTHSILGLVFLLICDLPEQQNIYTTSFLNKALESEMVEEEEEDRGNCPICVEAIQVGDQVLVVSLASLFSLQLSLWNRYLADNVPWMRCLATPRLPPWVPKGLALKVSASHLCLLITPFIFLWPCVHFFFSPTRQSTCPLCRQRLEI